MSNIILLVESLSFGVGESLQDAANTRHEFNKFLGERLLAELGELTLLAEGAEVLQVDAGFGEICDRLHGFLVDIGQGWVRRLDMLNILLFKIFKFTNQLLLEAAEVVGRQVLGIIVPRLQVANDIHKLLLTIEVILVGRVSDFVGDAVNLDKVCLKTFEHHSSETSLVVCYNKSKLGWVEKIVTYIWLCDRVPLELRLV